MFFNIDKSIPEDDDNITTPVIIYKNIKNNINTYGKCKYAFKRWRKYNEQFDNVRYIIKRWRKTCYSQRNYSQRNYSQRNWFNIIYQHINTYSLEYVMLFGVATIFYLKNQERNYICNNYRSYYDE
jgi:hypothetical protein